ncbi:hypothetical protein [Microbacterium sp. T32]|uniref:hypothetical protein n=1 Tax=Microbacterium sp. T32 TaxID=1776083 RepID=UPI0007AB93EF|nr:hypothetical protein [Microbacterium sp. T32]KZE42073.1 hypothetical protein AVW09_11145 [Microbacterium sp. T32]
MAEGTKDDPCARTCAGPRATLGLGDVRIVVPTRDDVEAFGERVRDHGIVAADDGRTLRLADPWGTRLAITPEVD